jgi:hypothetical protein
MLSRFFVCTSFLWDVDLVVYMALDFLLGYLFGTIKTTWIIFLISEVPHTQIAILIESLSFRCFMGL